MLIKVIKFAKLKKRVFITFLSKLANKDVNKAFFN
jgi:hypothetical protein